MPSGVLEKGLGVQDLFCLRIARCAVLLLSCSINVLALDTDYDTLPDDWELANGRDPGVADYAIELDDAAVCALTDRGDICEGSLPYKFLSADTEKKSDPRNYCRKVDMYGQPSDYYHISKTLSCSVSGINSISCYGVYQFVFENVQTGLASGACPYTSNYSYQTPTVIVNTVGDVGHIAVSSNQVCALTSRGVECWTASVYYSGPLGLVSTGFKNYFMDADGDKSSRSYDANDFDISIYDSDDDNDGVSNAADNCSLASNLDQLDGDGDGLGDVCDNNGDVALSVSTGSQFTCVRTTTNGVKCWGRNPFGQLGDNTTIDKYVPVDVSGLGGVVNAVATGSNHACALTVAGGVRCWGYNGSGQLGDDTTTQRNIPVDVVGLSSGVSAIAAGGDNTCALMTAGGMKCWGNNSFGQLGNNTTTYSKTPVDVMGAGGVGLLGGITAIEVGGYHTCALMATGGVKCWGSNGYGQLGDNTTTQRNTPMDVVSLSSGVTAISAGDNHTCALMAAGGVKCWGSNTMGPLGDNTSTQRQSPVDVVGTGGVGLLGGVNAISAGGSHTCALLTTGEMKCWGRNVEGQRGDNTTAYELSPQDVLDAGGVELLDGITAISAGGLHSCAVTTTGGVKCWGQGTYGQLGGITGWQQLVPVYVKGMMGDEEGDGVVDLHDNCPSTTNPTQADFDGDTQGDACDTDDDNDGVLDINDAFPLNPAEWLDTDSDGTGNNADTDDDNDGVADTADKFPLDANRWQRIRHNTDFDNDSDVLIRSTSTGTWTRYSIQNNAIVGNGAINAPTSSDNVYVAQLDANGDGDADILTRSATTGAWTLSIVENGAVTSSVPLYLYANLGYVFVGTGDFNNDGIDDVMLRHATNGYRVFLLANHAVSTSVYYNAWTAASSVDQGIGDFNGDGTDDLLVRRTSDNLYFIFKTINGEVNNYYCACNIWANTDWTFQFAGDTNKDGIDDIVIRGTGPSADGKWWAFRMNNFSSALTTNLNLFLNKTAISVGAVGDYNGDGTIDVLTRVNNSTTYVSPIVNGTVTGNYWLYNFTTDQVIGK